MAWVDDASLLCWLGLRYLSDAEGRGIVHEVRAETAERVASYQTDQKGEPG